MWDEGEVQQNQKEKMQDDREQSTIFLKRFVKNERQLALLHASLVSFWPCMLTFYTLLLLKPRTNLNTTSLEFQSEYR